MPSFSHAAWSLLSGVLLLATPAEAAADTDWQPYRVAPSLEEWDALSRWRQYFWWRPVRGHAEVLLPFTRRLLERDPDDLVAAILAGQLSTELPSGDGAEPAAPLVPEDPDASPGEWARAAGVCVALAHDPGWRSAIDEVVTRYEAAGRLEDASFAAHLRAFFRFGYRDTALRESDLAEIRRLAAATGNPVDDALALLQEAALAFARNYRESLEPRERALALLEEHAPGSFAHAWALVDLGSTLRRTGRAQEAVARYREAVTVARAVDDPRLEAAAHQGIGQVIRRAGDAEGALEHYERARELLLRIRDTRRVVVLNLNLRPLLHQLGRLAAARASAVETLELAREHEFFAELPDALDGMGSEEALVGRLDRARALFEEAIHAAKDASRRVPPSVYVHLATLLIEIEDFEGAELVIEEGLEVSRAAANR
ncbi:MAG TPA: hypothetical protein VKU85_05695, partial [bacterium]|nr:hypothetical protein [bacterium]